MPSVSFPLFAIAGALAALTAVVAHLIAMRRRAPQPLPTLRFVPGSQQRNASLERRPRDLSLLLLRAAALFFTGLGLARPVLTASEREESRLTIADLTGAADVTEVLDSVRTVAGARGQVIVSTDTLQFVSAASLPALDPPRTSPSLTAAFLAAHRIAASGQGRVALSLVSAFTDRSVDSATQAVRQLWPGPVRIVRVAGDTVTDQASAVELRGASDDPYAAGVALLGRSGNRSAVIVRDSLTQADSAYAREGGVVVYWPRNGSAPAFVAADRVDTVSGLFIGDRTWIAPLERQWRAARPAPRSPVRWIDGHPAVLEQPLGRGCFRSVGLEVPDTGDLLISRGFQHLLRVLGEPCGGIMSYAPLSGAELERFAGTGTETVRPRGASVAGSGRSSALLLLALATLALAAEMILRRRTR